MYPKQTVRIRQLLMAGMLAAACAHSPVAVAPIGGHDDLFLPLPVDELHTQRLFRVRLSGEAGGGGLRMVLRLETEDRYQLASSDLLGRAVWSLEYQDHGVLILHHKNKTFCEASHEVVVPEAAFEELPLRSLPKVLLGRFPVGAGEVIVNESGRLELRDHAGRRWTVRLTGGVLGSWTLWKEGRPLVWWTRSGNGGILSHREGFQFRWRLVVSEPLGETLNSLEIPRDYQSITCHDPDLSQLRKDQSSS